MTLSFVAHGKNAWHYLHSMQMKALTGRVAHHPNLGLLHRLVAQSAPDGLSILEVAKHWSMT